MFIVNLDQFIALPDNTLYQKYEPINTGELEIKAGNQIGSSQDFIVLSVTGVSATEFQDSGQMVDMFFKLGEQVATVGYSQSVPLSNEETSRDGLNEPKQLFLVYEQSDIDTMIGMLKNCVGAVRPI